MGQLQRSWLGTVSSVLGFAAAEAAIAVPGFTLLEASLGRGVDSALVVVPMVLSPVMALAAVILGIVVLVRGGQNKGSVILGMVFSVVAFVLLSVFITRTW